MLTPVAAALAETLGAGVEALVVDGPEGPAEDARAVAAALDDPDCLALVLAAGGLSTPFTREVVRATEKPVVLVSGRVRPPAHPVGRVLLPLDGSPESAAAVSGAAGLFAGAGVDLVALHVFGDRTAPMFWDQTAHAGSAWSEEFLSRNLPVGSPRLELRCGSPGEHVLGVADAEDIDLIGLGWSRDLSPGRATTVRETVAASRVPVLLCPVPGGAAAPHGDATAHGGAIPGGGSGSVRRPRS